MTPATHRQQPRISVFPKCYFDELCRGDMDYREWLRSAATLGGEGVEHYDGFFRSYAAADVDPALHVMDETDQISSMLCFSPDFTHPDARERERQVERQRSAMDLAVRLGTRFCRTLSGQNRPGLTRADGIARTVDGLCRSIEYAETRNVVLCLENHYKDGTWQYAEFAQTEDIYLEILERVDSPNLGVQYDPSNALVGGYDPVRFLEKVVTRVVTMHASDRYFSNGALVHGETGKGQIDYNAIFGILSRAGFAGWISVEDGMNGLDELRRSVAFLKAKRCEYYT
jgi:sugar phosphate isomerase/epimerase